MYNSTFYININVCNVYLEHLIRDKCTFYGFILLLLKKEEKKSRPTDPIFKIQLRTSKLFFLIGLIAFHAGEGDTLGLLNTSPGVLKTYGNVPQIWIDFCKQSL